MSGGEAFSTTKHAQHFSDVEAKMSEDEDFGEEFLDEEDTGDEEGDDDETENGLSYLDSSKAIHVSIQ